ncbi:MAG: imidazoleglycerol-phosphate dehydratase HisB [Chthonomonadales bacterium]
MVQLAPRIAQVARKTNETDIEVKVNLDGVGAGDIKTGVAFFDHMLNHVAKHGSLDLYVRADGDLEIDDHHTVEDVGIAIGKALGEALGDRAGITRYGDSMIPMDEALTICAIDISGRGMSVVELQPKAEKVGDFSTEMAPEFFRALAHNAGITVHIRQLSGSNAHHILESAFKAFGRALAVAVSRSGKSSEIPSTKGIL